MPGDAVLTPAISAITGRLVEGRSVLLLPAQSKEPAPCPAMCGYVYRSSGLAKTILQDTVKGERRQGRQKKSWEDNIRKWIGLGFAKSKRAAENKKKWRKLVVKSSVMPLRPLRLRDKRSEEM